MDGLDIRNISVANLPDLVNPVILAGTLRNGLTLPSEQGDAMTRSKLAFFHDRMAAGAAAMGAYRNGRIVGVLEYYPVEVAPAAVTGNEIFVIHSLEVPEDEGRDEIKKELVAACVKHWSTRKGVVVLGRGEAWDALGFEEVSRETWPEGDELVLWLMKFWEVEEPRITPHEFRVPTLKGKVRVDIFMSGACPWNLYVDRLVTEVAGEFGSSAMVEHTDCEERTAVLENGLSAGVALNGAFQPWFHPHPLPTAKTVRQAIEDRL